MKRELKDWEYNPKLAAAISRGHKANPDEKGTESPSALSAQTIIAAVTKPIPMKRELKEMGCISQLALSQQGHKANPDEKGTESKATMGRVWIDELGHKANPDEKGTESSSSPGGP